jgi:hypothetical protein
MRFLLVAVFILQTSLPSYCQHTDSFTRSIDSSAKQIQRSYKVLQDSLERLRIQQSIRENGKPLDAFLADYEHQKKKERQQVYIRVGLGVIFLGALIYGIARKRKQRKTPAD